MPFPGDQVLKVGDSPGYIIGARTDVENTGQKEEVEKHMTGREQDDDRQTTGSR